MRRGSEADRFPHVQELYRVAPDAGTEAGVAHRHLDRRITEELELLGGTPSFASGDLTHASAGRSPIWRRRSRVELCDLGCKERAVVDRDVVDGA